MWPLVLPRHFMLGYSLSCKPSDVGALVSLLTGRLLASQSEYDEFISSGLYLVVLLHFCEQRFSDVLGAVDAAGVRTRTCTHSQTHSLNLPIQC